MLGAESWHRCSTLAADMPGRSRPGSPAGPSSWASGLVAALPSPSSHPHAPSLAPATPCSRLPAAASCVAALRLSSIAGPALTRAPSLPQPSGSGRPSQRSSVLPANTIALRDAPTRPVYHRPHRNGRDGSDVRRQAGPRPRLLLVCDLPSEFEALQAAYKDRPNIRVVRDGHLVSRGSDFIIYSVDAEHFQSTVAQYGPSTKLGAIVAGQTSVKAPEQEAFEKYLPPDTKICSLHSLHSPFLPPDGHLLVIIPHRCSPAEQQAVMKVLAPLSSRYVELSYQEHDEVMANTQACTHAAFLSMGTAWCSTGNFPWESGRYVGGIEVAKIIITLRIYASKWHVYAGLAILNPAAKAQIHQFAKSTTELFILMVSGDEAELRRRVYAGRDYVFGSPDSPKRSSLPPFASEEMFSRFAMGEPSVAPSPPNSHLTLLSIVDCWYQAQLNPIYHLELAATPIFRLWFGLVQHLFTSKTRLDEAISAAVNTLEYRTDDCEYVIAARGWSQCVSYGDFKLYQKRFEDAADFFRPRNVESLEKSNAMLAFISQHDAAGLQVLGSSA